MIVKHGLLTLIYLQQFCHNDKLMMKWMCHIRLQEEVSFDKLLARLGLEEVIRVLPTPHFQWFSKVSCAKAETSINSVTSTSIHGKVEE